MAVHRGRTKKDKKPITIRLRAEAYKGLVELAEDEFRSAVQQATKIIVDHINGHWRKTNGKP